MQSVVKQLGLALGCEAPERHARTIRVSLKTMDIGRTRLEAISRPILQSVDH